jgi:hypothetical protein
MTAVMRSVALDYTRVQSVVRTAMAYYASIKKVKA